MGSSLKESTALPLVLIAVVGLFIYSNTFHVPFQWDEEYFIEENPFVKDLSYFFESSRAKGLPLHSTLKSRYIGYLTFALNYKLHGLDVTGYHIFNITIHVLNALLVYFLVILTFRTPFMTSSSLKEHSKYIALFTGLLFVSHPAQTEAVTYIFQRLASLMAFFYLLSLVAYTGSRLSTGKTARYTLYALSFVSVVLAMKTKENAFTLPFVMVLYEFLFFTGLKQRRILYLIPFILTLFIVPLTLTGINEPIGEIIGGIGPATKGHEGISRVDYLLTELRVIVTYLRLLLLPVNQNLDYDYPVYHSFFNPQVYLSFLFFFSISGLAVYLLCRSKKEPALRLVAFGIFWFFITLSVESSLIPLPMLIDEYRLYLPSAGAFFASVTGMFIILRKVKSKKIQKAIICAVILTPLVLSHAAYIRNNIWTSRISLWEDVVKKSPRKARGHINLGAAYKSEGLFDKALKHYGIALSLRPDYAETHNNLGVIYESTGLFDKALNHFQIALRLEPDNAAVHNNLGVAYGSKGLFNKAITHYRRALSLKPDYAEVHNNLGIAYRSKGLSDKAITHYRRALSLKPDYAEAHYNLGIAYRSKGLSDKAIKHYRRALSLKPDYAEAHNNLGIVYSSEGLSDKAIKHYRRALSLKPDYADAHYNLGLVYFEKGLMEEARRELETALQINSDHHKARKLLGRTKNQGQ